MKVVYSGSYGGFHLSEEAVRWLIKRQWRFVETIGEAVVVHYQSAPRHDPLLVECVEALGPIASGHKTKLAIANVKSAYEIIDNDGLEIVQEKYVCGYTDEEVDLRVKLAASAARIEASLAERAACVDIAKKLALDYEARAKLPHAKGTQLWGTRMTQACVADEVASAISKRGGAATLSDEVLESILASRGLRVIRADSASSTANDDPAKADADRKQEASRLAKCRAGRDGECVDKRCPQRRDGEPSKSRRSCPLFWAFDEDDP